MARGLCTPRINIPSGIPCEQLLGTKGRPGDSLRTLAVSHEAAVGAAAPVHEQGLSPGMHLAVAVQPWPALLAVDVTWLQVSMVEGF